MWPTKQSTVRIIKGLSFKEPQKSSDLAARSGCRWPVLCPGSASWYKLCKLMPLFPQLLNGGDDTRSSCFCDGLPVSWGMQSAWPVSTAQTLTGCITDGKTDPEKFWFAWGHILTSYFQKLGLFCSKSCFVPIDCSSLLVPKLWFKSVYLPYVSTKLGDRLLSSETVLE